MRVVEFLKDFGRFDATRKEEEYILEHYEKYFSENALQQNSAHEDAIDTFISKYKDILC